MATNKEIESLSAMLTDALQPYPHSQGQQNILHIKDQSADQENVMIRDLHVPVSGPPLKDTSINPPVSTSIPYKHEITLLYLPIPSLHPPYTRNRLFYGLYKHLINLREI